MSRRLTYVAAVAVLLFGNSLFAAQTTRAYVAGHFAVELDGKSGGYLSSVGGGFLSGNVVDEPASPDYFFKKHIEEPSSYSDITIEFGLGASPELFQWIKDAMEGKYLRKNGAILALDAQNNIVRRLDFSSAQITEIIFPRLDAASKSAPAFRIQLTPAATFLSYKGGKYSATIGGPSKALGSNFRLSIGGLTTTGVSTVEEIDIKIPLAPPPDQACVSCVPTPVMISFPRFEFVGSEANAATWFAWHQSFVIQGQNTDADEKSGTLELLDQTLKSSLFTLSFSNVGIISVSIDPQVAGDSISRARASLYAERITISKAPGLP